MTTSILEPGDLGYNPEQRSHAGKYYGDYRGVVMKNNDPEKRGRVRCYIPSIMGGSSNVEDLWSDWALPKNAGDSKDDDSGILNVPAEGTNVWITFEMGHPDFPVWEGGFFTTTAQRAPKIGRGLADSLEATPKVVVDVTIPGSTGGSSQYPHNRVMKLPSGWVLELDDTPSNRRFRLRHPTGTFLELTDTGGAVLRAEGDTSIQGENVTLAGSTKVVIASSVVKLGGNTLVLPLQGVIQGEAIDPFTGLTQAALGNASTIVGARKI